MNGKPWSREEVDFLRQVYPVGGSNKFREKFSGRSCFAVSNKANKLKLVCRSWFKKTLGVHGVHPNKNSWKLAEIAYLKKVYLAGGVSAFRSRFPKRTYSAVVGCTRKLGLKRRVRFSNDEEDFLRRVYPEGGVKAFRERFSLRSKTAVISHAFLLGIRYNPFWSKEKVAYLKKFYSVGGSKAFRLMFPDVPLHIIHKKVHKLGIKRQIFWSENEMQYLKKVYPESGSELFHLRFPQRSIRAIHNRARKFGISCLDIGFSKRGSRSPRWNGGSSFEPYSTGFTEHLKENVRDFYGRRCLNCGDAEGKLRLPVHHIDYNKKNHAIINLVSLCSSCHTATNSHRSVWKVHLKFLQKQYWKREGRPDSAKTQLHQGVFEVPTEGNSPSRINSPAQGFPVGKRVISDVCFPSHVDGLNRQGVD